MLATFPGTVYRWLMIGALLSFLLATAAMLQQQEPFYTWFYSFAWWSYVIFVESFLGVREHGTRLLAKPARFMVLLPLSITIWLLFEAFNFRLQNWHYLELPSSTARRWLGFTIAFATVLPALLATRELLDHLGFFRNLRVIPVRFHHPFLTFLPIGLIMLVSPLLFPSTCFPLVWIGFIFLLEPVNYQYGANSILRELEEGAPRNLCLLLLSGLVCGILWECWNFWAGAKWIYTVPHFDFLKIFEMPILGFLGFPPFAVECCVMVNAFFLLAGQVRKKLSQRATIMTWALLGLLAVSFDILIFLGIDTFTVVSLRAGK